jgi:hypothetical protein
LAFLALSVGILAGVSFLAPGRWGIPAATTSWLSVLWQVQATSVGLVLALAVFVFGLLPQGRGRLTYREFLRRTWALPLTVFNVASLLVSGMVQLGLGHQVPVAGAAASRGWAVSAATVVAMAAIGSVVVILARALNAIDPAMEADVQRQYRDSVVALTVRGEIVGREALRMLREGAVPCKFSASAEGMQPIQAPGRDRRIVRDVSLWGLAVLRWAASRKGRREPTIQVWPGAVVSPRATLMAIDESCGRLERWWARRCIRLSRVPPGLLGPALLGLHGEALEHIRAARPTEAVSGMRAMSNLLLPVWQAYAAHGRTWEPVPEARPGSLIAGAGERIIEMLADLLRAAAVSDDELIRGEACDLPCRIAERAVRNELPGAFQLGLRQLESVYKAIVGELSDGGRHELPVTSLARSRLYNPFASLLSFVDVPYFSFVDAVEAPTGGWQMPFRFSDLRGAHLKSANDVMLSMLRHAVEARDSATVRQVLSVWTLPDWPERLFDQPMEDVRADFDAMILRLLVTATHVEHDAWQSASADSLRGSDDGHDISADPILARLTAGRLCSALDMALHIPQPVGGWREMAEDSSQPARASVTFRADSQWPLLHAFALIGTSGSPALCEMRGAGDLLRQQPAGEHLFRPGREVLTQDRAPAGSPGGWTADGVTCPALAVSTSY